MSAEIIVEDAIIVMKNTYPKRFSRVDEAAQWIRRLATGTDLSLIPRTQMLEGEN